MAIIEEEIILFSDLLRAKNDKSYSNILEKMKVFKELINYDRKLEVLKECEDLQCETFFLNSHNEFKEKIEVHFYQYRNFKKNVFSVINNK